MVGIYPTEQQLEQGARMWEEIKRLADALRQIGVNTQTSPRLPTREERIDAAIANLAIDRPDMTDEECRQLKEEMLRGDAE